MIEFENLEFSIDAERRTLHGTVVPWDKIGRHSNGRKWRFSRGSLKYADAKYLRLNDEHVQSAKLGRAIFAEETADGLVMTFKVYDGPAGDAALAAAAQKRKTGFSVEIEADQADTEPDPENPGVLLVNMAHLTGVGFVKSPAFDEARLISMRASQEGTGMPEETETQGAAPAVEPGALTFSQEQFAAFLESVRTPAAPAERPAVIDPTGGVTQTAQVTEPLPYAFSRTGTGTYSFSADTEHDFSTDVLKVLNGKTTGAAYDAEIARLNGFVKAAFADVEVADLPGSLTSVRKPEMWVPQRDYATPLWDLTGRGAPPEGGRKFDIPKFTSSSGLVSVATEKTEPAAGSFVDELQTVTPGQLWGKVEITRQVWRQGGNPAFSGILWAQMIRAFYEAREAAVATFLATLTAATDIALTGTPAAPDNDDYQATMESFEQAYADLQFARGGNRFSAFAVHQALYRVGSRVKDDMGRPLYPILAPQNANGTTASQYRTIDVAGSTWVPAYALGTPANASTNSWLFDPAVVMFWCSAPERLFWDFGATVQTANLPQLSYVTLGLYADYAAANTDVSGVRQVTFDPNTEA